MPDQSLKRPDEISPEVREFVIEFLNSFPSAEDLDTAIDIPDEPDIGLALSERILEKRDAVGGFDDLNQLVEIDQIGLARFNQIVSVLGTRPSRAVLGVTKSGGASWIDEYRELIEQVIWDIFLKLIKKMILKKFGKKAAAAVAAALVDGPLPIGDIVALVILIWGVIDVFYGTYQMTRLYQSLPGEIDQIFGTLLDSMTRDFGDDWLRNEHNQDCFRKYMADLVYAFCASTKREKKRRKKEARNKLKSCVRRR